MLAMYCKDAEERGAGLLTPSTIRARDCSTSALLCGDDLDSDHEENDGVESVDNEVEDDNDSISAQSDTQKGIDDNISDDDHEQQVPMLFTLHSFCVLCSILTRILFFYFN